MNPQQDPFRVYSLEVVPEKNPSPVGTPPVAPGGSARRRAKRDGGSASGFPARGVNTAGTRMPIAPVK
jgi:hypothetical protein